MLNVMKGSIYDYHDVHVEDGVKGGEIGLVRACARAL